MSSTLFRIPHGEYEGNTRYLGNGLSRFCLKCNAYRPYSSGGQSIGPKGMKHWICKIHTPKINHDTHTLPTV
jgi:hypothetical protein